MVLNTKPSTAYLAVAAEIIALLYLLSFGAFGDGDMTGFKPDCARNITISNSVNGNDSQDCLNGIVSCATLNYAFTECYILNNSTFRVKEGHHELTGDLGTVYNSTLSRLSDLTISGEGSDRTTISGLGRYGFAFVNITGLILSGIEFINCSQSRPSTSFGEGKSLIKKSEPFHVGIYVWRCTDVLIQDISVGESQSVGLVVYETRGTVTISDSIFHDNIIELKEGSNLPGGGGVNIEFPYCPPGHFKDSECGENFDFNSYANYTIHNCTFRENIAHTIVDSASQFILPNRSYHQSFGRGGGMAVYFSGNASHITMTISQCQFIKNQAIYGAGLFAEFHDKAQNNYLAITNNSFTLNECYNFDKDRGAGGGGMRIAFVFYIEPMSVMNNTVTIDNNHFEGNRAYFGGALSFLSGLEQQTVNPTNKVTIRNSVWRENYARLGSAAYFSGFNQVRIGLPPIIEFESNTLESNSINYYDENAFSYIAGSGTVYCYSMPIRLRGSNIFTHNIGTGIVVVGVGIQILQDSTTEFVGNMASDGGGMAFYANGWVTLYPNTSVQFQNNTVTGKGGALYAETTGAHGILTSRDCFIRYSQWWVGAENWSCTISFDNNHAHGEGSDIYISSVYLCIWGGSYGKANTSLEIRKKVFHWSPFKYSGNESGSIASGISDVKWDGPKNSTEFSVFIVPGQLYDFSKHITLYNDYNESATTPLFVSVIVTDSQDQDNEQGIVIPSDSSFTVNTLRLLVRGKGQQNGKIELRSVNDPPMTFFLNVTTLPCPPGAWLTPSKVNTSIIANVCECTSPGNKGHLIGVTCIGGDRDIVTQRTRGYWVGFDKQQDLPVTASCPQYFCNDTKEGFGRIQLEGNDFSKYVCALNREGEICGKCTNVTNIVATSISFRCEECHSSSGGAWVKWFALELSLATVVVALILVLDINVACGVFCSFVFFSQIMLSLNIQLCQCTGSHSEKDSFRTFQLLYSFWSLRLSYIIPDALDVCLPEFNNAIYPLTVGYIFAFYPFFLILVVWLIARCHKHKFQMCCNNNQRCCKRARELVDNCFNFLSQRISVFNGIATCLVITYSKLTHISLFILAPVSINTPYHVNPTSDSPTSLRVWYSGHWTYFSTPHLYFGLGAIAVLLVFVIFPPLFLLSYPALPNLVLRCNKKWGGRLHDFYSKDAIHHLLDIFQGHYKEKCKLFAGMWFLYRLALDANNIFNESIWSLFAVQILLGTFFLLLHAIIQPYKKRRYNIVDFFFFANIILLSTLASLASQTEDIDKTSYQVIISIFLGLPYVYFLTVGCKKVYNSIKSYCDGKKRGTDQERLVQQQQQQQQQQPDDRGGRYQRPELLDDSEEQPAQELSRIEDTS